MEPVGNGALVPRDRAAETVCVAAKLVVAVHLVSRMLLGSALCDREEAISPPRGETGSCSILVPCRNRSGELVPEQMELVEKENVSASDLRSAATVLYRRVDYCPIEAL